MAAAAAAAGENPQGMHPNQMVGNLKKEKNINSLSAYDALNSKSD